MKHGKTIEEIRKAEAKAKVILEEAEQQRISIIDEARKESIKIVEESMQPKEITDLGIEKEKATITRETEKELRSLRNNSKNSIKKAVTYVEKKFLEGVAKC